ncbi:YslB family protein [Heyndrickxia acidiproducens]|uniref:YslB family protein n=1 Tax=Heyndrickxia acidiproducens TaxID=1121084 RepID=UPI00036A2551|nr:YslB family protein [Heyndrickxia acidiproducens]
MKSSIDNEQATSGRLTVPAFGYELLRNILIPDIFGKETPEILYWAGKHLARKFPLLSSDELISFFEEAGWGALSIKKEEKYRIEFELSSPIIDRQLDMGKESTFKLEAGFLAEQYQQRMKLVTEATEEVQKRSKTVQIIVQWDQKDPVIDD